MEHFVETREVQRIKLPDLSRLSAEYLVPGRPVIIIGALRGTKIETWSPEHLKERIGRTCVRVFVSDSGRYDLNQNIDRAGPRDAVETTLAEFIDEIITTGDDNRPGNSYLQQASIPSTFPELIPDIRVANFIKPDLVTALNLWMGPGGTVTPLHYDLGNNFLIQVYGRKRLVLFEPDQTPVLYAHKVGMVRYPHLSRADIDNPDFEAHPRLREAIPTIAVLNPGDVLVIPSSCWHQVYGLTPSISINIWWHVLDVQLLTPGFTRLTPILYRQLRESFNNSIKHGFESFYEYTQALRGAGEDQASFLCHLMLLEGYLENLGKQHFIGYHGTEKGVDTALRVSRQLARAEALSPHQLYEIEAWFELGQRLLTFRDIDDIDFGGFDGIMNSISAIVASSHVRATSDRPSLFRNG